MSNIPERQRLQDLLSQAARWQKHEAAMRGIRELLKNNDPKPVLVGIFEVAEDYKLGYQMHLLDRFGVEAETMTLLAGFRPPRTVEDAKDLIMAGSLHTFWAHIVKINGEVLRERAAAQVMAASLPYFMRRTRRDPYVAVVEEVLATFEELPATFGVIAQAATNQEIKAWAAARLASWIDTQINLERNKRLKAALKEGKLPPEHMKLLELLPASLIAFGEWEPGEPFRSGSGGKSYVSRVANTLVETGSEQAEKNKEGKKDKEGESKSPRLEFIDPERPEAGNEDPDLEAAEDSLDKEHNRRLLNDLVSQAGLSKQQRQVYELVREGFERIEEGGYTNKEIAAQLDIAEGTIKAQKSRAFNKLRAVASRIHNGT